MQVNQGYKLSQIKEEVKLISNRSKEEYVIIKVLGEGAFGKVFEASQESTHKSYAIKVLSRQANRGLSYESYSNEKKIMLGLNSPNIVNIQDHWEDQENGYLVMDYVDGGDLGTVMKATGPMPEAKAISYLIQILNGIKCFHQHQPIIVHRDLKPDNILRTKEDQLKIADLGVSREITDAKEIMNTVAGTPLYMGPEIMFCEPYDIKCDLYSIGVILYEMVYGQVPYTSNSPYNLGKLLESQKGKNPPHRINGIIISDKLQNLLSHMLQIRPKDRIAFEQLYQHELFIVDPFGDKYLNDVENQTISESLMEQSKLVFSDIKKGIKNTDGKSIIKGIGQLGSMFADKAKISLQKQQNKFKDFVDQYKKGKIDNALIIEVTNQYLTDLNIYNLIGSAIEQIKVKQEKANISQNQTLASIYLMAQYMLWKQILYYYQAMECNTRDKTFKYNQIDCQDKLFVHKYFLKLKVLIGNTITIIKNEIDKIIILIQQNQINSLESYQNPSVTQEIANTSAIINKNNLFYYTIRYYKEQCIYLQQLQQNSEQYQQQQIHIYNILMSLCLESELIGMDMNKFCKYRADCQKYSIEELQQKINDLVLKYSIQ